MIIPSLPFLTTASLPEVVWIVVSLVAMAISTGAWFRDARPRVRLKNLIRAGTSGVFFACGVASAFTPPPVNPTWLSVLTPMTFAFGVTSMALLTVIDEQSTTPSGG